MWTVKQVSEKTGISVRALHYYDKIGLLKPDGVTGAGYRLYDDKALGKLQQILFFKEFGMPLKEIRSLLDGPSFDRRDALRRQRRILQLKQKQLKNLIGLIDDLMKGESLMDNQVLNREELDSMFQAMVKDLKEEQKKALAEKFGGLEGYREFFLKSAQDLAAQRNYLKMLEWYGGKDKYLEAMANRPGEETALAYMKRSKEIYARLACEKGKDVHSFQVKRIVGELDFVMKQLFRMEDVSAMMLETARLYLEDEGIARRCDEEYGEGGTRFIGQAIQTFYDA